jgi:hypothetical protein
MLRREREDVGLGRKINGLGHGSARGLGRAGRLRPPGGGIEDRANTGPDCASPNSAFDILGPRLPSRRRQLRKDHAYQLAEGDRGDEGPRKTGDRSEPLARESTARRSGSRTSSKSQRQSEAARPLSRRHEVNAPWDGGCGEPANSARSAVIMTAIRQPHMLTAWMRAPILYARCTMTGLGAPASVKLGVAMRLFRLSVRGDVPSGSCEAPSQSRVAATDLADWLRS